MFSCFFTVTWTEKTLETTCDQLVTVIFWGESAGISGKIHCDLPEGIYPMGQMLHWSIHRHKAECDNSWRFRSPVPTLEKYTHRPFFAQRLLESLLREAGCVFSVCRNICRHTELCLLVCICLVPVVLLLCRGNKDSCDHAHAHGGLARDCECKQFVCIFFAHYCFSSPWRDNTELLPDSAEARKTKELNGVQRDFD